MTYPFPPDNAQPTIDELAIARQIAALRANPELYNDADPFELEDGAFPPLPLQPSDADDFPTVQRSERWIQINAFVLPRHGNVQHTFSIVSPDDILLLAGIQAYVQPGSYELDGIEIDHRQLYFSRMTPDGDVIGGGAVFDPVDFSIFSRKHPVPVRLGIVGPAYPIYGLELRLTPRIPPGADTVVPLVFSLYGRTREQMDRFGVPLAFR